MSDEKREGALDRVRATLSYLSECDPDIAWMGGMTLADLRATLATLDAVTRERDAAREALREADRVLDLVWHRGYCDGPVYGAVASASEAVKAALSPEAQEPGNE